MGFPAECERATAEALQRPSKNRDAETGSAFALALLHDGRAERVAADLDRRFPENTLVQFGALPFLRAQIMLNRHDPERAIELLQPAASYELGWQCSATAGFCVSLYVVYVRGEAMLERGRGADAAAEFQNIIDHMGVLSNDPTIAMAARVQLARAWATAGERQKAKSAYQIF